MSTKKKSNSGNPARMSAAAPEMPQTAVTFREDRTALDLIAELPNGEEVRVPLSLTGDDLDRMLPLMSDLESVTQSEDVDPAAAFGKFREMFPPDVWQVTGALPLPWCMEIRAEWVQRLGSLMGKALSG